MCALAEAQQRLGVANHLLGRTYPMVNDARILLAVAKELHNAAFAGMDALLAHDKAAKRIPALVKNVDGRLELLQESLAVHKLSPQFHKTVTQLHAIISLHEKAPVEFTKPDRFVLCDKDYQLTTVTVASVKQLLSQTRSFLDSVSPIVSEDARIPV
ncbi:hypothetical protein HY492_01090 [Candidatus Woesearchaeota archaeon]|nr:hypothetical protein [Candidatus Woesearchaeota archaeon]